MLCYAVGKPVVLPFMRGRLEAASNIQLIVRKHTVWRGNAGKKFTKGGVESQFGPIKPGIYTVSELRTNIPQHLQLLYIHAVKYICQGTNVHFVICRIFTMLIF